MQAGNEVVVPWFECQGMRDVQTGNRDPQFASWLQNMFPLDPERGGPLVARPGFKLMTGTPAAVGVACQLLYEYEQSTGTVLAVGLFGGEIYTAASGAWTRVVTSANLTTAGVTLSTTAKCYAVTYTGLMVISDGANRAFTWNGTSGAGGLTLLTNTSGAWYGAPTVYYAKLVGILASDRTTFEWSEENASNTGYQAGGYTNAWTLGQNGSAPLSRLYGTNTALLYWRTQGLGLISGAVNADFSTSGVHDAISRSVGTVFPNSVVGVGDATCFVDQHFRPWAVVPGGQLIPLWQAISRQFTNLGGASLSNVFYAPVFNSSNTADLTDATGWERRLMWGTLGADTSVHRVSSVYFPNRDQVVFFLRNAPSDSLNHDFTLGVAYHPGTWRCQGYWFVNWGCTEAVVLRTVFSVEPQPSVLVLGGTPYAGGTAMAVGYARGQSGGADAAGFINALGLSPVHRVVGPKLLWDPTKRWSFHELSWVVRQRSEAAMYSYSSRYFTSESPTVDVAPAAQSFTRPTASTTDHRNAFGISGLGRWIAPSCEITVGSEDATRHDFPIVYGCEVRGRPLAPESAAR